MRGAEVTFMKIFLILGISLWLLFVVSPYHCSVLIIIILTKILNHTNSFLIDSFINFIFWIDSFINFIFWIDSFINFIFWIIDSLSTSFSELLILLLNLFSGLLILLLNLFSGLLIILLNLFSGLLIILLLYFLNYWLFYQQKFWIIDYLFY